MSLPLSSLLPTEVEKIFAPVPLDTSLVKIDIDSVQAFQKAANYLALAQIYLASNGILHKPLAVEHIKKRLLGHWGTCPGLIFAYSHVTAAIQFNSDKHRFLFVTGPGHGAPATLASLYLEGTISRFFHEEGQTLDGIEKFVRKFSWPGVDRPSHVNANTPGAIHEGGELGYALAVAYGSVMDRPDLITAVVVGDGEAETGPTATAWHAHKFIDPSESGAVIPILHLNRFKISETTIFGTMDKRELLALFTGYGYQVRIVAYEDFAQGHTQPGDESVKGLDKAMAAAIQWAINEIDLIQKAARGGGKPIVKPRWPMLIMSTPKGWGCPPVIDGLKIEGSYRSHQVPVGDMQTNKSHFKILNDWLLSYNPHKWFQVGDDSVLKINPLITNILPKDRSLVLGQLPELYEVTPPLDMTFWGDFGISMDHDVSAMEACGKLLADAIKRNPHTFRMFSPDELVSNKLGAVLEVKDIGHRNLQSDPDTMLTEPGKGGRIIEMLSEHTLQGFCQGYSLTGRTSLFPSYESFLGIVATMIEQYAKFLKNGKETTFRVKVPSLNYIETSTLWRQEHNGYSHQNPGLINSFLNLPHDVARVYLPPDANCTLSTLSHCLRSKNYVNLIVGSKHPTRQWLDVATADRHCTAGASVWEKYSTDGGKTPDVVLVGIGVETTSEIIATSALLQKDFKDLRVRVVNITDLMILAESKSHPHALDAEDLASLLTPDKPLIFSFHGYPSAIKSLVSDRLTPLTGPRRLVSYHGYQEQGSTTTPWSMLRLNQVDRFSIAQSALKLLSAEGNVKVSYKAFEARALYDHQKRYHEKYILEHGEDPEEFIRVPSFD
ncbi:hypothetical protein CBS101457_002209 [Exobasidium rhododendri]|nr:hypothetical protein CBS101457_002209 [Exobasidium rhododendri]